MTTSLMPNTGSKTEKRFWAFHNSNPHVYEALVKISRGLKARGINKYAIAGVFEVARWERIMSTDTHEEYKLSNDFKPYYARLIMEQEHDLQGFFDLRALHA